MDVDAGLRGKTSGKPLRRPTGELFRFGAARTWAGGVHGEVAAERELRQADELRSLSGRDSDPGLEPCGVFLRIGVPALLECGDAKRRPLGSTGSGGGAWQGRCLDEANLVDAETLGARLAAVSLEQAVEFHMSRATAAAP